MSQASMESFLLGESDEQLITRCVKASVNPSSVEFHRADSFNAARSLDETERLLRIRAEFFIGFFCERHREWRITSVIPLAVQHMVTVDEADLTDDKVLQGIQDLRQAGKFRGEPRTVAEVAADQAEADRLAILRDLAERKELIDRLMAAQPKNTRETRISDAQFAHTREVVRKEFERMTTEHLRQKVRELDFSSQMRSMSHDDLVAAARQGVVAPTEQTDAQSRRESPEYALPSEYTVARLKSMSPQELKRLTQYPNGQSRTVSQYSHIPMMAAVNDRLAGRS
jgi:hypothetical protein